MMINQYPMGSRILKTTDFLIGLVTGQVADIPISTLAALISGSGGFWLGGPTSARPNPPTQFMMYFDQTLGQPIWCKQATPSIVWVNAAGVPV